MATSPLRVPMDEPTLLTTTIRELTTLEPRTMELLAPLGLDLCCGGGHELGEALRLHQIDGAIVVPGILSLFGSDESTN